MSPLPGGMTTAPTTTCISVASVDMRTEMADGWLQRGDDSWNPCNITFRFQLAVTAGKVGYGEHNSDSQRAEGRKLKKSCARN